MILTTGGPLGTAFKPCATTAVQSGGRTADPPVPRGFVDRRACPQISTAPDHRHPPPRPVRSCASEGGPQDDRRIGCPRSRTVRARRVARGRRERVRSTPTHPGTGTPPGRSAHSTPPGLDPVTSSRPMSKIADQLQDWSNTVRGDGQRSTVRIASSARMPRSKSDRARPSWARRENSSGASRAASRSPSLRSSSASAPYAGKGSFVELIAP